MTKKTGIKMTVKEFEEWVQYCKDKKPHGSYNYENWVKLSIDLRMKIGKHANRVWPIYHKNGKLLTTVLI